MAQLKDLIVNGATRLIGDAYVNKIQITNLIAPTSAGSSTYGPGTEGQVLLSNNGSVYWGSAAPTVTESTVSGWGFTKIGTTATTAAAGNHTHTTSLETDNGAATITLAHNTTYKLTAGGTNVIFKTPTIPTKISSFTNDAEYITSADVPEGASAYAGTISAVGTSANTGTDNGFARGDHVHNITKATIDNRLGTGSGTTKYYREDGTWQVPPNTGDTHYTAYLRAGASGGTANVTTTTGNTYLNLVENGANRSGVKLVPGSNMTITSDANGNVTFTATNTVTTVTTSGNGNAITAISASNGAITATKGTTFLTSHQDISGKADKSATVSTVAWDSTNKKITKTINGSSTDVVQFAAGSNITLTGASGKLTIGINGTLPVANGGTGNTSFTAGRLVYAESASKLAETKFAHLNYQDGTTSTDGYEELVLGNTTATGTAGNTFGRIALYSNNTKGSYITAASTTATNWPNHVLPATAGWLVTAGNGSTTGAGSASVPVYISTSGIATSVSANSVITNLASTSGASIYAASPRPGVTGTLPVANGGTGVTSAADAPWVQKSGDTMTGSLTVGSLTDTVEQSINVSSGAGRITLFSHASSDGYRGIYAPSPTAPETGIGILTVDKNNIVGYAPGYVSYWRITSANDVSGTSAPGTSAPLVIGPEGGDHLEIDANEILAKSDGTTPSTLYLQDTTGTVEVCGSGGLYASNGLLKTYCNGNLLTIGSQNNAYCHFYSQYNPFYFNRNIEVDGSVMQYPNSIVSMPFINGRDTAAVKVPTYNNYHAGLSMKTTNGSWEIGVYTSNNLWFTYVPDTQYSSQQNSGYFQTHMSADGKVWGAVYNDYAEMRNVPEAQNEDNPLRPGTCVREVGDGTMVPTTERLQRGCKIISDTFGFNIGETDNCKTPIAVSGRALVYLDQDREIARDYIGWPVCSGPNGTVSIMTEEEEEKYPSRIVGTISEIPDYEKWGSSNVEVNGRIWIYVK